jgi:RES domain-containing protein
MGGETSDGRWHIAAHGKRIVYLSEHAAVALVEVLAHLQSNPKLLPAQYRLIKVVLSDDVSTESVAADSLPHDWGEHLTKTQSIGDAWLARGASALLKVPSASTPESFNYLLNPLHPDARKIEVEWCKRIQFDRQIFRTFV